MVTSEEFDQAHGFFSQMRKVQQAIIDIKEIISENPERPFLEEALINAIDELYLRRNSIQENWRRLYSELFKRTFREQGGFEGIEILKHLQCINTSDLWMRTLTQPNNLGNHHEGAADALVKGTVDLVRHTFGSIAWHRQSTPAMFHKVLVLQVQRMNKELTDIIIRDIAANEDHSSVIKNVKITFYNHPDKNTRIYWDAGQTYFAFKDFEFYVSGSEAGLSIMCKAWRNPK